MNMLAPKRPGFHCVERGVTHALMGWQKMEGAILWTPLLTPLVQMNMFTPTGLVFHLVEKGVERNLNGHFRILRVS
jgi:hypothetical protein